MDSMLEVETGGGGGGRILGMDSMLEVETGGGGGGILGMDSSGGGVSSMRIGEEAVGGGGGGFCLILCASFSSFHPGDACLFLMIPLRVGFHSSSLPILDFPLPISCSISFMDLGGETLVHSGYSWSESLSEEMSDRTHSGSWS